MEPDKAGASNRPEKTVLALRIGKSSGKY
jgi:hypothetical protein